MTTLLQERITAYLSGGGLFNPEMAIHTAVRDLLIDCRAALAAEQANQPQAGWKLVPIEPTEAMEQAMADSIGVPCKAYRIWADTIAAAPEAP